ncbi:hypothetical protein P691DRAFT_806551, partial [Macrolepiota fuliginosa MF-IS2]
MAKQVLETEDCYMRDAVNVLRNSTHSFWNIGLHGWGHCDAAQDLEPYMIQIFKKASTY